MGFYWTFYDYVDENGENLINRWLNNEGKKAKSKFNSWIRHLEGTAPGKWKRPLIDTLTDDCEGLLEIRAIQSGINYRLLVFHGPDQCRPTLALGIIKQTDKVPPEDCKRTLRIKEIVDGDPTNRRVEHDFNGQT